MGVRGERAEGARKIKENIVIPVLERRLRRERQRVY
jgi:hypothetical protein